MTKVILIFISISIFGCSSEGDSSVKINSNDPILGKWKLSKEVYYNTTNNTTNERLSNNCENISSVEYKSNNTILFISYTENSSNNCAIEPNNWEYAKWQNLGNNNYKLTSKISGQSEETEAINIEFQNSYTLIIKGNSSGVYNSQPFNYSKEYYIKI